MLLPFSKLLLLMLHTKFQDPISNGSGPSASVTDRRSDRETDVPTFIFLLDILHVRKVSNNTKRTQQYPLLLRIKSYFQRL